jgi:hypothetical protein
MVDEKLRELSIVQEYIPLLEKLVDGEIKNDGESEESEENEENEENEESQ